uniref:ATPase inhibitor, mitochondrial n=1 Tax=Romanomermis culicivorax TaxID=13658 RepID=A0A915JXT0_ROMCU
MTLFLRRCRLIANALLKMSDKNMNPSVAFYGGQTGELGSGAGKGGGSGGSVRDAGGAFGKMEVAREEEYFRRLQKEQLKTLRLQLDNEVAFHEEHIRHHQEAIARHKRRMDNLQKEEESLEKK